MLAFQFPTQVTAAGDLVLPHHYLRAIPAGSALQVLLLIEPPTSDADQGGEAADATLSLEAYTAYLRQRPLPQSLTTKANGLLGAHLAHPLHPALPDFDEAAWNAEWDQIEVTMNADEWADEQDRLQALHEDWQP